MAFNLEDVVEIIRKEGVGDTPAMSWITMGDAIAVMRFPMQKGDQPRFGVVKIENPERRPYLEEIWWVYAVSGQSKEVMQLCTGVAGDLGVDLKVEYIQGMLARKRKLVHVTPAQNLKKISELNSI